MKFFILISAFFFQSLLVWAQPDTVISLRIIDTKICFNKKTSALNFSYYFENHSTDHIVVIDYYEPCIWEFLKTPGDSDRTLGLVLVIKDDVGNVVHPTIVPDSAAKLQLEKYHEDSLKFSESYEKTRDKDYIFHTRSLRPQDVLINLYNLKLNRRKCFYKSQFNFDYTRKYKVSLHYLAKDDIHKLLNKSAVSPEDKIFIGELYSNEVELCFK